MKPSSWILFGLACLLTLGVLAMVTRQARQSPKERFAEIERLAAAGKVDREQTIASLDQVYDAAVEHGDVELATRVQLSRGRMLMELGAFDRARDDLSAVAAVRPGDVSVENDLVELESRSGDFRAAQERVSRMIQRDPSSLAGYVRLGRLHQRAADRTLGNALEVLRRKLVPESYDRARALLEHSTALLPSDPRRVALAEELRTLLSSDDTTLEDAINATDQVCQDLESARAAYTRSLEHGADPEAVAGLIRLFVRAGQTPLGADLGTMLVRFGPVRSDPAFAQAFLASLVELGRIGYAADLVALWLAPPNVVTADFCAQSCDVLRLAKRWTNLHDAAALLRQLGSLEQQIWAEVYLGIAFIELGDWASGRQHALQFALRETTEPFPKARPLTWRYIARACRQLSDPIGERTALQGLVDLDPRLDPDAWLRLAELQMASPHGGYREPELRWARGMSLLPNRAAELLPRWDEIGALELRAAGIDLSAVKADLQRDKVWTPSADASPYELYRLAELHADAGDTLRALTHTRALLEKVPGFVPGLDLAIRVSDLAGKEKERMTYLIERVRLAGRTSAIDAILRETSLLELPPATLLSLMRADPDRSGRLALADGLAREGRADEALALVRDLAPETLGDEGQLLLGRLHLLRHDPANALGVLAPLAPRIYTQPEGIELLTRAAAGTNDRARLNTLGADLASVVETPLDPSLPPSQRPFVLSRKRTLWIVDQMLASGAGEGAETLLGALDASPRLRGGDVNLRLAGAAVARGDLTQASVALERAQAFDTQGTADYLALLLAASEGRVDELRYLAGVTASNFQPGGALLPVQLMLLSERGEDAALSIEKALRGSAVDDPWWNLTGYAASLLRPGGEPFAFSPYLGRSAQAAAEDLFRGPAGTDDPRLALVWIGAARQPIAAPFVRAWIERMERERGSPNLWIEWLRASLDLQSGFTGSALASAQRLTTRLSDFGPAWDLDESIHAASLRSKSEIASARARRLGALGLRGGTRLERVLDDAREKAAAGLYDEALAAASQAVADDPTSTAASLACAEIQIQMGRRLPAITTLRTLIGARVKAGKPVASPLDARSGVDFVPAYLDAIEAGRRLDGGTLTWGRAAQLLDELERHLPDDPRVALAAAALQLEQDKRNPTLGVSRAYSRLERFRSAHKRTSLERLGSGSVRAWARFLMRLDPARARAFVEEELALRPTHVESWIELARAREAEGDREGALAELRTTARLVPHGKVEREILRLLAIGDYPPEKLDAAIAAIVSAEGLEGADAGLSLLHARGVMNQGPRVVERVLQLIARADPQVLTPELATERLLLSASALVMRGRAADKPSARGLVDELLRRDLDPYARGFVEALGGLAKAP